ncbi:MAG: translation initiation factor IF-2 [Bacteriovoracaceae bacterium]|jgi:translation initiation factor IF-2|nr:translation initiation factor IF-2 [Bacteriovoracaceae bacterium]
MPKKVFELANEIGIGAIDLVEKLKDMGMNVRNHMVTLKDDEVKKAMEAFGSNDEGTQKKAKKKKVTKKKATKKKVVKKVIKKSASSTKSEEEDNEKASPVKAKSEAKSASEKAETKAEPAKQAEDQADKPKVVKKVLRKKKSVKKSSDTADSETNSKKEVFKEKMHAFTPVYVPEQKAEEETSDSPQKQNGDSPAAYEKNAPKKPAKVDPSATDKGGANKKRMGDLAAMVSKKGAAGKAKDMTQIRADEEMKLASSVMGRTIYTPIKRKKTYSGSDAKQTEITEVKDSKRVVSIFGSVTAADLAQKLSQKFESFKNKCLELNLLVKKDDEIGLYLANEIANLYDYRAENKAFDETEVLGPETSKPKSDLPHRNPIITVMGHVDHGKTTLLDMIRKTKVTDAEAGGITQHIGAYSVKVDKSTITFLDTPGHAAFGSMRQRGADVTDIVVLVVAADDGVMPQTKESIKYARKAGCPIIVAVNKIDKEGANPDKIKQELTEFELVSEEWGGDTMFVSLSALKGDGIDDLLESIKLQAEMMDLRESPKGKAEGVIIESKIETGRGPVATVLVQRGTLKKGDAVVCGECFGRARTLMDTLGKNVNQAGPSIPVQILGFNEPPSPGDILNVVKNEREAKKVVDNRITERKKLEGVEVPKVASLEDFFANANVESGEKKVLNLVVRADVQGSYEAIKEALQALGNDEVGVEIIAGGVGAITDNDVTMAENTEGYIIGFNMRPVTSARKLAEQKGVEIRTYSVIYEVIDQVTAALEGMLTPESVEKYIGRAEVRDTFNIPKVGTIAGCGVIDGKIERGCNIRLLRDGKIMFDGKLSTLKRFKDEVKEVGNGYECGMALEGYNDIKNNDLIEAYILEQKERKLENSSTH